jgi:hypothetical protein
VLALSYDEIVDGWRTREPLQFWSSSASIADKLISVECDEPSFFDGFFMAFGGSVPAESGGNLKAFFAASIRVSGNSEYGCLTTFAAGAPYPIDGAFFGLTFEECPYESTFSPDGRWTLVSFPGESQPRFAFRDQHALFQLRPDWQVDVLTLLYRGALRLCGDLIFFHASALSIHGKGVLLVGRSKSGKSTTALALAARGHSLIADSCASYKPSTGELMPFGRPVGIREGPKSEAVRQALENAPVRAVQADDSVRVDLNSLLPNSRYRFEAVPADAIFFLKGFAEKTELTRLERGRNELANLQPIYSSFVDTPHTQRAFELIQLLSRARLYALRPGNPDEAARCIEEVMTS